MYRVIRISCLLRAILAELRSGATEEASIALNKQEIRITRYIRKRVTVLTLLLGKLWPPQYFISKQEICIAVHKCNTYLLFVFMYYIGDYVLANTWSLKKCRSIIYLLTMSIWHPLPRPNWQRCLSMTPKMDFEKSNVCQL